MPLASIAPDVEEVDNLLTLFKKGASKLMRKKAKFEMYSIRQTRK